MRTEKAKRANAPARHGMQTIMSLCKLYSACMQNATDLLAEAELLFDHDHLSRAFALAYTGWEEVGKAQLVGDYSSQMVAEEEFEAAFRDHHLKAAYNVSDPRNAGQAWSGTLA